MYDRVYAAMVDAKVDKYLDESEYYFINRPGIGPVASNHHNLYNKLLALLLGRYGLFQAKVNDTE